MNPREIWDGTKKSGGKPCIDMKGQPEVVLTSFQERKYGYAPPERRARRKPYWKIMDETRRDREEDERKDHDSRKRLIGTHNLQRAEEQFLAPPAPGWVKHEQPRTWWHARRQLFFSEDQKKYYILYNDKYTEIDPFHQTSAFSFAVSSAACSRTTSTKTKSLQINDLHAVAHVLRLYLGHLDEPAALHAVFRCDQAEILAKNLHQKLLPLLASYRGPWPAAKAAQALLSATQELGALEGVGECDMAIGLTLGTTFVCTTVGKAVVRTEDDGIISKGTPGSLEEHMPHLAAAEISMNFAAQLAAGVTPEEVEEGTKGSFSVFGRGRPRSWAGAVVSKSENIDTVAMGICVQEKAITDDKPSSSSVAKKQKVEATRIRCRHILVKHNESRSTVDKARGKPVTRTKFEAENKVRDLLAQVLEDKTQFAVLARQHSECSSALKGGEQSGDLGWFSRGKMQKPFEDEAFNLEVNRISDVVATESGVHIIERIA